MGVQNKDTSNKKVFSYPDYRAEENKQTSVLKGRCKQCLRMTDIFCDNCFDHVCENHVSHNELEYFCEQCRGDEAVPLTKKEMQGIREGTLRI